MLGRTSLRGLGAAAAAAVVGSALWVGGPAPAQAVVIANADVATSLRITGARFVDPANSSITLFTVPFAPFGGPPFVADAFIPEGDFNQLLMDSTSSATTLGGATAAASGAAQVLAGGVVQSSNVGDGFPPGAQFGFDAGPGLAALSDGVRESASANSTATGVIAQSNAFFGANGTVETFADFLDPFVGFADVVIDFELDIAYALSASTDDAPVSQANASVLVDVSCASCDIVLGALLADLAAVTTAIQPGQFQISDFLIGAGAKSVSGIVPFTVFYLASLAPFETVLLLSQASTGATRVPEPGTLTLFAVGLLGLGSLARRRRAA